MKKIMFGNSLMLLGIALLILMGLNIMPIYAFWPAAILVLVGFIMAVIGFSAKITNKSQGFGIYSVFRRSYAMKKHLLLILAAAVGYLSIKYLVAILPADGSYITVEPGQTAESYSAGLRQKYMLVLTLAGAYVLLYVIAWCVIGGMKRRTGQI